MASSLRELFDSMEPYEAFDVYITFLSTMSTRDAVLPYSTGTIMLMMHELSHLEGRMVKYNNFLPDIYNIIRSTEQALKESYDVMMRREERLRAKRRDDK